jgi:peptidoglycan-N-acetylglucosamine deacetylase
MGFFLKKYLYSPPGIIKKTFKDFIWETSNDKILLTFDDGPTPHTTEPILKTLNKLKIKALFFCVGENCRKYHDILEYILSEGHTIGNHTYTHKKLIGLNNSEIDFQIDSFNDLLKIRHNIIVKYFRPPHGVFNLSTKKILKEKSLKNIMWSLLTYDYKNDHTLLKFSVSKYLKKNSIIVLHDSRKSKDIIRQGIDFIFEEASKNNFEIGNPDECLN